MKVKAKYEKGKIFVTGELSNGHFGQPKVTVNRDCL